MGDVINIETGEKLKEGHEPLSAKDLVFVCECGSSFFEIVLRKNIKFTCVHCNKMHDHDYDFYEGVGSGEDHF